MDDELYKQNILDRYRHPRNKRVMADFDVREAGVHASCGDSLMLYLTFDKTGGNRKNGREIEDVSFDGEGCAISMAAADMLMGTIRGKNKEEILALGKDDMAGLLGVEVGMSREQCALLSLNTLKKAVTHPLPTSPPKEVEG